MNMYKFGNYICKLREEKGLTQAELANQLDVSDKSISKWENGQAFPRIETFEKLAVTLDTTVEDIFSASKDGIKRICIANDFYYVMHIDVDGQLGCSENMGLSRMLKMTFSFLIEFLIYIVGRFPKWELTSITRTKFTMSNLCPLEKHNEYFLSGRLSKR